MRRWIISSVLVALLGTPAIVEGADRKAKRPPPPEGVSMSTHKLYIKKCKSCHGYDGKGDTKRGIKTKANDWTKPGFLASFTDEKLYELTAKGIEKMPGYEDKLSAQEIRALVEYMRRLVPDSEAKPEPKK